MYCVICLEQNNNKYKKSSPAVFKCYTCNEGFVCNKCLPCVDKSGSIFLGTLREVKKVIKCPCCRTLNWNYHYNQVVQITLEGEDSLPENDACDLMIKNKYENKCCGCGENDTPYTKCRGKVGLNMCEECWEP